MPKSVLPQHEAERMAIAYSPRQFPSTISPLANEFVAHRHDTDGLGRHTSFQLDPIVSKQVGVHELERVAIEERVEMETLDRLKEIQEEAYRQAYQVGLEEGREKSFHEHREEIKVKLDHLEIAIRAIETLKSELVVANESHLVSLTYQIAKKIMMTEVVQRPEHVLEVIRKAIEAAAADEEVLVRLSVDDAAFVTGMREKLGKEFDQLKKAKIEVSDTLKNGGCIIETNYGAIDASVEQRAEKVWAALAEKIPQVHDKVSSEDPKS